VINLKVDKETQKVGNGERNNEDGNAVLQSRCSISLINIEWPTHKQIQKVKETTQKH
jgi:hypothetical protein